MLKSAIILTSVVAGVLVGYYSDSLIPGIISLGLGAMVIGISYLITKNGFARFNYKRRLQFLWSSLILLGLSALSSAWHSPHPKDISTGELCRIEAEVIDRNTNTKGESYIVEINQITEGNGNLIPCRNITAIFYADSDVILQPGDLIRYSSIIARNNKYSPGQAVYFTFQNNRISLQHEISNNNNNRFFKSDVEVFGSNENWVTQLRGFRDEITIRIEKSILSYDSKGLVRALLTGKRSGIEPERLNSFRDAGVTHTLAVSGMHVGIITMILLWLSLPFNLIGLRQFRFVFALVGAWTFAIITGLQLSTLRATLMLTLATVAILTGRRRHAFGSLCMAATIILIASPDALWDVGFQLSFSCVAALTLFAEYLIPINHKGYPILYKICGVLIATMVATFATWIITAHYFGSMPLNFISANLIMIPLLPLFMILGIAFVSLSWIGMETDWLAKMIDLFTDLLYRFLDIFKGSSINITPSIASVLLWMAGVITLAISIHRKTPSHRTLPGANIAGIKLTEGNVVLDKPLLLISIAFFIISLAIEII